MKTRKIKTFEIKVSIARHVKAKDEDFAAEKFWEDLENDNALENTTTESRLSDSMEIKEVTDEGEEEHGLIEEYECEYCV